MKYAEEKLSTIYQELQTDPQRGLQSQQLEKIKNERGLNVFEDEKAETLLAKVAHHLKDFTSLILLTAVAIAVYLGFTSDHGFTDAIVIFSIVVLNITLAVKQEMGAEKALDALRAMNEQTTVVIRDGVKQALEVSQLLPGDIMLLEAGDAICADGRIIEAVSFKVDEAVLTGESEAVEKDADARSDAEASIGDQLNMVFSGCLVTFGKATVVVVATGMSTEMGKIASLLNNSKKTRTPLQRKMDNLGMMICYIGLGAGAVLFALQYFTEPLMVVLLNAVSLAVAVIPECLPIIVTIILADGVSNMAKKQAIIRKMPAVETLGSTSIICSDKTGTLTMNKMTIKKIWAAGCQPKDAEDKLGHPEMRLLEMMGLASNASITIQDGKEVEIGDPTEMAIIRLLKDKEIDKESLAAIFPRLHEIPFDSNRKLMTTVHESDDLRDLSYISITKGAFDRIPVRVTPEFYQEAKAIHDEFASQALRIIAVAYKYYDELPEILDENELERGLVFAGFVGMIDPPRTESEAAVQTAKEAGIRSIMITGDHAMTAAAIAKEIGILTANDKIITGAELNKMSQPELIDKVKDYAVYARVSPEDKLRIVEAWQSYDEVVAMTGDGVNDAPALKTADVGVAMGSGTEVSKNASDVVLTDDNFASIVDAVSEGRRAYDNIRKVLWSLISCNFSEIFIMLFAVVMGWGMPLVAIQLLFINVVADGIPDLCMSKEGMEDDVMERKPLAKNASIFAGGLTWRIILVSAVFAIASLVAFYLGKFVQLSSEVGPSAAVGQTMAYVVIAWSSVVNIFNVRSFRKSIFRIGFTSNILLFWGICFSLVLVALTATVPGVASVFYCVPVSGTHWLIMIVLSLSPLVAVEIAKLIMRKKWE